jgi:hypothetical protein
MKSKVTGIGGLAVFASVVGGCATVPPPETRQINVSCEFPVIAPMAETYEVQTKGGMEITAAARRIACAEHMERLTTARPPTEAEDFQDHLRGIAMPHTETTTTPVFKPEPERIAFTLKINNQLSRVFRGQGAVVQFALDGSTWSGKEDDYVTFTNLMILPRGHAEIEIAGPPVQALKGGGSTGIIGISLFDVVTGMDAAGNVTEKQNFEWLYAYSTKTQNQAGTVTVVRQ